MANRASLDWDGDKLLARVAEAARVSINETLRETDAVASSSHWWHNRTGYGEAHILVEEAKVEGTRVSGKVGATYSGQKGVRSAFYLLFAEYRTPWLRPAGDRVFPTLASKIRRRLG
jgi:nitrate reductase alpha subunit